jgi:putative ABC transport system substrate-binding protein
MNRRDWIKGVAALAAAPSSSNAQPSGKIWRIGMLEPTDAASNSANLGAFRQGLAALGHVEGRTYSIEYRSAQGSTARFAALAAELVRLKVDVMVTRGTPATQAAQAAGSMPIVMSSTAAPELFAASLARPGGNVTGLSALNSELQGKRVQLLMELVPGVARLAVLRNLGNASNVASLKETEGAARTVNLQTLLLDVRSREDLAPAFDRAVKERAGALLVTNDGLMLSNAKLVVELAARHRMPVIYQSRDFVDAGGLISLGVNYPDLYRRAASYVDKLFKGAKPGDLPIEQPTKFDLVINAKTAKALGITIPQSVLLRADEVLQ